jgi:hypothetical protein
MRFCYNGFYWPVKAVADGNQVNIPGPAGGDGGPTLSGLIGLAGRPRPSRKQPQHTDRLKESVKAQWISHITPRMFWGYFYTTEDRTYIQFMNGNGNILYNIAWLDIR